VAAEIVDVLPVRGGAASVEQAGLREHERAGADRDDARQIAMMQAQPPDGPRLRRRHLGVPMILILGRYDYAVPYEAWDGLKARLPKLTYHLFERSSHFPMIDEPARFDETLIRWITASPRP
jgi:pimeloyl-ACP methyl ester carboxylesterase